MSLYAPIPVAPQAAATVEMAIAHFHSRDDIEEMLEAHEHDLSKQAEYCIDALAAGDLRAIAEMTANAVGTTPRIRRISDGYVVPVEMLQAAGLPGDLDFWRPYGDGARAVMNVEPADTSDRETRPLGYRALRPVPLCYREGVCAGTLAAVLFLKI